MLLALEKMVFQGMIDRLIEVGICYGMEMSWEKKGDENIKAAIRIRVYDRSKATGECGIFQLFG